MIKTIYHFELMHWLRRPSTYIYGIFLFLIAFGVTTGMAGESADRFAGRLVNTPVFLHGLNKRFMLLGFLCIPPIVGLAVHRDFSSNMYSMFFSYPFRKLEYALGKFSASFTIVCAIFLVMVMGYAIGAHMPWVNHEIVAPFDILTYAQMYFFVLLPNIFFVSIFTFSILLFTRSIYGAFVFVFIVVLIGEMMTFFSAQYPLFVNLLDPLGLAPIQYITQDWSVIEKNESQLPTSGVVLLNRIIWMGITMLIAIFSIMKFRMYEAHFFSFSKRRKGEKREGWQPITISKIELPHISKGHAFSHQLKASWHLSLHSSRYILTSKYFIILLLGGLIFTFMTMSSVSPRGGTETLPMTWKLLELPMLNYSGVINAITFLFTGMLLHREREAQMHQLVDVSPYDNWVFIFSKFLAIVKIQIILLLVLMIAGIFTQISKGFYNFEIGQYIFTLYGVHLIHFVIWAMMAFFIQTIFKNTFMAFFLLLLIPIGFVGISEFGPEFMGLHFLDQIMFRYNQSPGGIFGLYYSDLDGFGVLLKPYFVYKFYWFLAGVMLLIGCALLWRRGFVYSMKERLQIARSRWTGLLLKWSVAVAIVFTSMAATIYYTTNISGTHQSRTEKSSEIGAAEARYKKYENYNQPKIVSVAIDMNIYPDNRCFEASGAYTVKNKSSYPIDTILISYLSGLHTTYKFDRPFTIHTKDTISTLGHFDVVVLDRPLNSGDSMTMSFSNYDMPANILGGGDWVKRQGTFIRDDIFPRFGNYISFIRGYHGHGSSKKVIHPNDRHTHDHSYLAKDAGMISFEATVSTSKDQIAIAPGSLKKEWIEDDRRYFHYKMDRPIGCSYLFMSGDYKVTSDLWNDVALEIFYDKKHDYNIDHIMEGVKAGLSYCSKHFSPYQFDQLRVVEFAQTGGVSAHGYPGTIPTGEGAGFIADISNGDYDYAFGTAVHEVAHEWWGHQVLPADALGAKLIVEGMADYVAAQVTKEVKGVDAYRALIKGNQEAYLRSRTRDRRHESPLMYSHPDQNYIHYNKGAIALSALAEYVGADNLNEAIASYVSTVAFQEDNFTTSPEFVAHIRRVVPDSMQYLIADLFETVTLYDNRITEWNTRKLENGTYEVTLDFIISKYRNVQRNTERYSDNGLDSLSYPIPGTSEVVHSLPLKDYVEIAIFGKDKKELFLDKIEVTAIANTMTFIVDEEPLSVGVDPYFILIDKDLKDNNNRKK